MVDKNIYYERCIINIDVKVIKAINGAPDLHSPFGWLEEADRCGPRKVTLTEKEHQKFLALIGQYHSADGQELIGHAKLIEILAFLGEQFAQDKGWEGHIKNPGSIPEQALLLVEENFRDIKISDIAEKLYVNSSYLSVIFKEEYGVTLEQYLIIRKIAEAKKYLYRGLPVNEACQLCDFTKIQILAGPLRNTRDVPPESWKN